MRVHQVPFPLLDDEHVEKMLQEGVAKHSSAPASTRPERKCVVPAGPPVGMVNFRLLYCRCILTKFCRLQQLYL